MPENISSLPIATSKNTHEIAVTSYQSRRIEHWDQCAKKWGKRIGAGAFYHRRVEQIFKFSIPKQMRVLELGCGDGRLLASLEPCHGVGVDFSSEILTQAKQENPNLVFIQADAHALPINETFDFIILSDLVNDLWDVQSALEQLPKLCHSQTRIVCNFYSRVWAWPLSAARRMRLIKPLLSQNWLTANDLTNMLSLAGFQTVRHWHEVLCPIQIPLVDWLFNCVVVKLWPFKFLALTNFLIARPSPALCPPPDDEPVVSVIVPARNEQGNIEQIIKRTPTLGRGTELIFVEGNSTDQTYAEIEKAIVNHPNRNIKLFRQEGKGKGDAVRKGFAHATGEVLMILDADMTVAPEDLPRFYEALRSGKGDFINGVRLVYPMEDRAMRPLNFLGNKFFSYAFSWLLGQPLKDSLCGTKVLSRKNYEKIAANRAYFGEFDPFGDFDLIFGAAKLNLKIVDLPIRYRERTYGDTNINRWRHGMILLRMVGFAMWRIKFV